MQRKSKNKLSFLGIIVSSLFLLMLVGCWGSNPPISDDTKKKDDSKTETKADFPDTPDVSSDFFDISYSNESEIKNCADGLLLINKNHNFEEDIIKLSVKWGNKEQSFDTYNPLIEFDNIHSSEYEYTFSNNSLIPMSATKIWVEALNSDNEVLEKGCVSVEKYKKKNNLLYEFQVISDQHLSYAEVFYRHSDNAFADIKENSPDSALIAVNGDIIDEVNASYYDKFYETFYNNYSEDDKTKLLVGLGNHEFIVQSEDGNYSGVSDAELTQRYNERLQLWKEKTNNDSPYFYYQSNGSYFIFLGTTDMPHRLDGNTRADCTLGEEQLTWLKNLLVEAGKTNKPIYLFSHGSLRNTVSGSITELDQTWYGYTQAEENKLRDIIEDYPQLMMFSGHSHWSFESYSPYLVNDDMPSYFNTASVGYLWQGTGSGEHYDKGTYENGGSQGLYIEVYEDQIFIKGRQFEASDGVSKYWNSCYQVVLPL